MLVHPMESRKLWVTEQVGKMHNCKRVYKDGRIEIKQNANRLHLGQYLCVGAPDGIQEAVGDRAGWQNAQL